MKKKYFWIRLIVSGGLIAFLFYSVDFSTVATIVSQSNIAYIVIAILIALGDRVFMAYKWNILLRAKAIRISLVELTGTYLTTTFLGLFLPATVGGDALRAYAVSKDGHNASDVISSIIVERALGFIALFVFVLAGIFPQRAIWFVKWITQYVIPGRFRDQLNGLAENFLGGLAALRSPKDVMMIFITSIVIWLLETGKYWFVMHAFPLEVSFFTLMLMNGIVNLATTIPSAPGYVGTFDAPGIAVLQAYGVDKAIAAGYTLVLHIALWVPITALGAYYLAKAGIKWDRSMEQVRADDEG